ncbi:MAG: hypothetical protein V3U87_10785 [Methylococcaceae bacterium]
MEIHQPLDANGTDIALGDWVRVISVPTSIKLMPQDSKDAFGKAVGETLQISGFREDGCVELDFYPKLGLDTIWLEPYCCIRFRRYKKFSENFKRILKLNKELDEKYNT